jgi:hypothetical protein
MGLATAGVALFAFDALMLSVIVLIWFPLKLILKKSPRASAALSLLLPVLLILTGESTPIVAFGVGAGAIIFIRHLGDWHRR